VVVMLAKLEVVTSDAYRKRPYAVKGHVTIVSYYMVGMANILPGSKQS
jgi:hypothetical protein